MALPASGPASQATRPALKLTGRGAVLGMAVLFTLGLLVASWLGVTILAGILFVLGCALAAWFTRPSDLLIVVLTPPILFLGALIFAEAVTASGSLFLSVAAGSVVVLASIAFWLAAGLVVTVAIALPRGLPRYVGELLQDLRADVAQLRAARRARGNKATSVAPRGRGIIKTTGPASRSPGSTRTVARAPRGPGNVKGPTPRPRTRRTAQAAPKAPDSADRVADAR